MSKKPLRSFNITYLIIMSFLGLFLTGMLTVYPPRVHENLLWRRPLIGSIFALICGFGILAVSTQHGVQEFLISEKRSLVAFTSASLLLMELPPLSKDIILIAKTSLLTCFR